MHRQNTSDSTALIKRSINNDHSNAAEPESDEPCCNCCSTSNCHTGKYTCVPWVAFCDAVADSTCNESEDEVISKQDCVTSIIITPFIAPFALLGSVCGFFYGAGLDIADCSKRTCGNEKASRVNPATEPLKMTV